MERLSRLSPGPSTHSIRVVLRKVLAGYMTAYKPSNIFEFMDAESTALQQASTSLLAVVHSAASTLAAGGLLLDVERGGEFQQLLHEHMQAFEAWSNPDSERLVERITHALRALLVAELGMANYPPTDPTRILLAQQLARLRGKLVQIGGQEAVARFQANLLANPPVATVHAADHMQEE